jgi:two-component system, OmpR family, phosphate regulon sensor histidine kinase PhoR
LRVHIPCLSAEFAAGQDVLFSKFAEGNSIMRFSRVLRNFLLLYFVLHFALAGLFLMTITESQKHRMLEQTQQRMYAMSASLRQTVADNPEKFSDEQFFLQTKKLAIETDVRITLITADGTVLSDSRAEANGLKNHKNRPELQMAQTSSFGTDRRVSDTLGVPMYYLAVVLTDETSKKPVGYIRVAVDTVPVETAIGSLTQSTWVFAIVLAIVACTITFFFAVRQMQPLATFAEVAAEAAKGNFGRRLSVREHQGEWDILANAFDRMQGELAKRESKLIESNQRFKTIFEKMSDGVILVDAVGNVVTSNSASRDLLSLSHHDIFGRSIVESVRIPEFQSAIETCILTNEAQQCFFETLGQSRRKLFVRVIPMPGQTPNEMILVVQDRTQMEQLAAMRTEFVASASHELKTPLASIRAYAETLRMIVHDEPQHVDRFVTQIETSVDQINQQIQDLLQITRIESGKKTFHSATINVEKCCKESIKRHIAEADHRNIAVKLIPVQKAVYAWADEEAVQIMIDNLVSNAIRYARPNGEVVVSTVNEGSNAIINVSDNGIGIAPKYHERVFERFFRVDKARSRDLGGTGLGLSIVKHLAQSFGGNVSLTSALGRGSTFTIVLPNASADTNTDSES